MNKTANQNRWILYGALLFLLGCLLIRPGTGAAEPGEDPWKRLQEVVKKKQEIKKPPCAVEAEDPWAKLRAIYLPFTEEEEKEAVTGTAAGQKVAAGIHTRLTAYEPFIKEASARFNVPIEIITAVIMVESGGNANAKAPTSSASGLMQTISSTFAEAGSALAAQGIEITPDPFDPRASIMAGTWYLDRMYAAAAADRPDFCVDRNRVASWKYPLEYYYAGPSYGSNRSPVVIIYANGKKILVDKPAYSGKVLQWAKILRGNA
jgi:soluble lytic murein transglycosylase-like protein